jgi:hypothetical protein
VGVVWMQGVCVGDMWKLAVKFRKDMEALIAAEAPFTMLPLFSLGTTDVVATQDRMPAARDFSVIVSNWGESGIQASYTHEKASAVVTSTRSGACRQSVVLSHV